MTAPADTAADEAATLGAALLDCDAVMPVYREMGLKVSDFSEPRNRALYSAMVQMRSANEVIDVLTIARKTGVDMDALNQILDACAVSTQGPFYAEQVIEHSRKRRLADLAVVITEQARNGKASADILADVRAGLADFDAALPAPEELFEVLRLSKIQAYTPDPAHAVAGDGWLRRGAGCLLTGGTGTGKSILAQQIALDVASGVNVLGCISVKHPGRVLYVQAENDTDTIRRDVLSIVKHAEPKLCPVLVESNFRIAHVYGLGGIDFAVWLRREFDKGAPDLLVIDPYQAFLGGESDINSTACFLSWIRPVNKLIQNAECALLLVTHTPKPRDRDSWTARESVYLAAGSSAISNWARTSAELTQAGEQDGRFRLRFGKNAERNGVVSESGGIVRDLFIEHSGSVHTPFWKMSDTQAEPSKSKYSAQIVKMALAHPSMSQRAIADEVGCSLGMVSKFYPRDEK